MSDFLSVDLYPNLNIIYKKPSAHPGNLTGELFEEHGPVYEKNVFFVFLFHTLSDKNVFSLYTFQDFIQSINRYTAWIWDANHNIVEFSLEIKLCS